MPIILPSTLQMEGEKPHATQPWLWLFELQLSRGDESTPSVLMRSSNSDQTVTWPVGSPDGEEWHPVPFSFTAIEQNQEGDLPQLQAQLDNTTRFFMRYLHAGRIEGNRATLFLVPSASLAIAYPDHEFLRWDMLVASVQADSEAITLQLERPNFFARTSPSDRYIPKRCRWKFGSSLCGYVINGFAAFTTCDKSLSACIERGADLVARGLPPVLPGNYGGHPGIATPR